MNREVILVCDGAIVWRGVVKAARRDAAVSTRELFEDAWRVALQENAVTPGDAGRVQFRFSSP